MKNEINKISKEDLEKIKEQINEVLDHFPPYIRRLKYPNFETISIPEEPVQRDRSHFDHISSFGDFDKSTKKRSLASLVAEEIDFALDQSSFFDYLEISHNHAFRLSEECGIPLSVDTDFLKIPILRISNPKFSDLNSFDVYNLIRRRAFVSILELLISVKPVHMGDFAKVKESLSYEPWLKNSYFLNAVSIDPAFLQSSIGLEQVKRINLIDENESKLLRNALKMGVGNIQKRDFHKKSDVEARDVLTVRLIYFLLLNIVPRFREIPNIELYQILKERNYLYRYPKLDLARRHGNKGGKDVFDEVLRKFKKDLPRIDSINHFKLSRLESNLSML